MPVVSIITPVYNIENCIGDCIESVLAQDFKSYELILVDDGSSDHSGKICDDYACKDARIKVIHQSNGAPTLARNTALDFAQGEYIAFLDGDDLIPEHYLSTLLNIMMPERADGISCFLKLFMDGNQPDTGDVTCSNYQVVSGKEGTLFYYGENGDVPSNVGGKIFKKETIGSDKFPIGDIHEDQLFIPFTIYKCSKFVVLKSTMYLYRIRSNSIMHVPFHEKRFDDVKELDACISFFEKRNEQEIVEAAKRTREIIISKYNLYARETGVKIPEGLYRSNIRALVYLKKYVTNEKFEYCLGKVYPSLVAPYELLHSLMRRSGRKNETQK